MSDFVGILTRYYWNYIDINKPSVSKINAYEPSFHSTCLKEGRSCLGIFNGQIANMMTFDNASKESFFWPVSNDLHRIFIIRIIRLTLKRYPSVKAQSLSVCAPLRKFERSGPSMLNAGNLYLGFSEIFPPVNFRAEPDFHLLAPPMTF